MRRAGSTAAEYLSGLDGWRLAKVTRLRELILSTAPRVRETVRSGFLYYEDQGDLFALAAQKHYVSLYVLATDAMTANADALDGLDHGKGCIRFRARTEIPELGIARILKAAAASSERDCRTS